MLKFNTDEFGSLEFASLAVITNELADLDAEYNDIMCSGFNKNSGYVYIALECGVTIASCFGQSVRFIVHDHKSGEELEYKTFQRAITYNKMYS